MRKNYLLRRQGKLMTTEEFYMLIGYREAQIYELNKQLDAMRQANLDLVNELNKERQSNNSGIDRLREFNSRVADFPKSLESSEATDKHIPEPERTTERL